MAAERILIVAATYVRNLNGKQIAIIDGYTFYACNSLSGNLDTSMWRCTKGYPCKARFKALNTGEIVRVTTLEHEHVPPAIDVHDGILYKLAKKKPTPVTYATHMR
ncbi:jg19941 [Pararge aegeria aegeria]|uniref:Jg19941 protein n=1 Tax=Pararge aegeria aegeria TaxID=348720 RepID=A0A8S4S2V4_9NEOP|nr:jg19941 [Pararge aegeria aegeria]